MSNSTPGVHAELKTMDTGRHGLVISHYCSLRRAPDSKTAHLAELRQKGDVRGERLTEGGVTMQTLQPGVGGRLTYMWQVGTGAKVLRLLCLSSGHRLSPHIHLVQHTYVHVYMRTLCNMPGSCVAT